jgi:chlorophyll synthase
MAQEEDIPTSARIVRFFFKQMKPVFWGVSILPFYIGWSLGAKALFPSESIDILVFIMGILIMGPFLGGATILYNDYWDRNVDLGNKRKTNLPLLLGLLEPGSIIRISISLFVISIILSILASLLMRSLWFFFFVTLIIVFSIIYSRPPIRLKERPGLDLLTNSIGSGVFCSLAGWVVAKPIIEFPILWAVLSILGVGSIFIPTTIIDHESDIKNKVTTISTYLGKHKAFYIGMFCVISGNIVIVILGLTHYIISPEFLMFTWPIIVIQIGLYWYLLRKLDFDGGYYSILSVSLLMAVGNGCILLYNAGYLAIP